MYALRVCPVTVTSAQNRTNTLHFNMVAEGCASGDNASSKAHEKIPTFNGKISTWPAFRIQAKGYFARKGWTDVVLKGASTTQPPSKLIYIYGGARGVVRDSLHLRDTQ